MIDIEVKQHDRFSVEFKSGITITSQNPEDVNEFMINTWMFVPSSLDINRTTYPKEQFYKDVKTNLRLITPIYTLEEVLAEGRGPFPRLRKSVDQLFENPEDAEITENYSYQIKMLMCISNSALRRESHKICATESSSKITALTEKYVNNTRTIAERYRSYHQCLESDLLTDEHRQFFLFGDEFLGNIIEKHTFSIMKSLKGAKAYSSIKPLLTQLIKDEMDHKKYRGFMVLEPKEERRNSLVILQRTILKKFVESDLFLLIVRKKDGAFAKQVYYGIAAAVAMIFATVISFIATQRLGNFTTDLFIILVISYVFKDRIKDVMRYYFTSTLSKKYFDTKLKLSIRNQEIGYMKEAFDFIDDDKLPEEIYALRNRTPLVEAEHKVYGEQIILYRKRVILSRKDIEKYKEYRLTGINDITRFNLMSYLQKMDNPSIPLYTLNEFEGFETIEGAKVYSLYFILNCVSDTNEYNKKYRILFNRSGITDVRELN